MTHALWYPGHELLLGDITRAENCFLFDSAGNRFVDLAAGVWCTSIGHGNARVLRTMTEQAARIAHTGFGYTNRIVDAAAQEVLSVLGFAGGRCVFLCSGSEAVEYGVRVAQTIIDRPLLMTMSDSYCGAYGSASARRTDEWYSFDWAPCRERPAGTECTGDCDAWAQIPFDRIGGFLLEPGSSSGLVRFPPVKLIRSIARTIRRQGGLLLVNEVTTGIGRTGTWFGFDHYGIEPDIVAMGKGIGNGYPVSVTALSRGTADSLGDTPIAYAQSHQNDPLGAAVAGEVIRTIRDEGLIERGREIGEMLLAGLQAIQDGSGRIAAIRGRGLMVAIELEDDPGGVLAADLQHQLLSRGFVVPRRPGLPILRLDPSLTVERADIEAFLAAFEAVLVEGR